MKYTNKVVEFEQTQSIHERINYLLWKYQNTTPINEFALEQSNQLLA